MIALQDSPWFRCPADGWLRHILELHFDPERGSRYWIEKAAERRISVKSDIRCLEDLAAFGPMDEQALATRPVEDFIPRCFHAHKQRFVLGDTGGTTGCPKITAYRDDEFYVNFVDFFGYVAESCHFPTEQNWLWVGPSGPHIIGKAARMLPARMQSMDAFCVDFDPRWIKKLKSGSLGWERYFQHIEAQALHILRTQAVGVLFSTPPVLQRLAAKMDAAARQAITGVHYGGLALTPQMYRVFKEQMFPGAIHLSGYGNTLFGVCLEVPARQHRQVRYFPPGPRLQLNIVPPGCPGESVKQQMSRLEQAVAYGQTGQVVFHRLDESFLIINMFERDQATRIPASREARMLGLDLDGLADPAPLAAAETGPKAAFGLY